MPALFQPGDRVPPVTLARLVGGEVQTVSLQAVLARRRVVTVGVPGAFTPICTREHIPGFIATAPKLKAAGYDLILCIAPNDPWTLDAWAAQVDPDEKILFLSDGNLAFARAVGAAITDYPHFLGDTSTRFLMTTRDSVIERLTIEPAPMSLTCTRSEDVLIAA